MRCFSNLKNTGTTDVIIDSNLKKTSFFNSIWFSFFTKSYFLHNLYINAFFGQKYPRLLFKQPISLFNETSLVFFYQSTIFNFF